jgi:phosphate starvation-inducible PhoH-like protein
MPRERIPEASEALQRAIFGPMDRHLRAVREHYGVRVSARNEVLTLEGNDAAAVKEVARRLKRLIARMRGSGTPPPPAVIEDVLFGDGKGEARPERVTRPNGARQSHGGAGPGGPAIRGGAPLKRPTPRTPGQQLYVDAIRGNDVVFAVGPAGTGKTYLAVVEAVAALRSGAVRRIILTRPAVEAGEKLGFLPGDFHAKINPYLRPLYDALGELMPWAEVQRYIDADVIEIVPLAYMRGRTLKAAFIILDEGQNTTPAQMKMFLTRMGEGSKVVVNGDHTQIDLPETVRSGLVDSIQILDGVKGLEIIRFGPQDIQRHALVQRIVDAYDKDDERKAAANDAR